jgi:hypothetical protein
MPSEIQQAMRQVEKLRGRLLADLGKAIDKVDAADRELIEATRAAREAGISFREMREATGGRRSHEFFRSLLSRGKR